MRFYETLKHVWSLFFSAEYRDREKRRKERMKRKDRPFSPTIEILELPENKRRILLTANPPWDTIEPVLPEAEETSEGETEETFFRKLGEENPDIGKLLEDLTTEDDEEED